MAALATGLIFAHIDLGTVIVYEASGLNNTDSPLYFAVARGILNGLVPYRDLFESKPPGVFLLHAISLWLSGSEILVRALQILMLLSLPFLIAVGCFRAAAMGFQKSTLLPVAAFFLAGLIFTIYLQQRSGALQTELFGAYFGMLYVFAISKARTSTRPHIPTMIVASIGIFGAVFMKEPFVFTIVASAFLLLRNIRAWLYYFCIPLVIAGVTELIVLASLGYLDAYIHVYLSFMTGIHINRFGSPWVRALSVHRLLLDAATFSAFFAAVLVGIFGLRILAPLRELRKNPIRGLLQFIP